MIITKTPLRVSFFGGGTDYPAWYRENGGAALAASIDKYIYITCRYLPPFFEYKSRISYTLIELVKTTDSIKHPSVRACLEHLKIHDGVEIHYDGDLPARTGLGSSSSFTVGLLKALHGLRGEVAGNLELGLEAAHVEQDLIPENVGSQDQLTAAVGGFNRLTFGPGNKIAVDPFILDPKRTALFQSHLMLVFTGFSRSASTIAGRLIGNIGKRKKELRVVREMVDEAAKILNRKEPRDYSDFGRLLDAGWKVKRSLAEGISTPEIDAMYSAACKAGALGGKLLGAGGGGFLLLFAPPERHARIRAALKDLLHIPFHFDNLGSQIVYYKFDDPKSWVFPERRKGSRP